MRIIENSTEKEKIMQILENKYPGLQCSYHNSLP
jgi:hypothetical protein